jgi:hypothetical protein
VTSKSRRWLALLIAAAVVTATAVVMPVLVPGVVGTGKGGPGPNPFLSQAPSILLLAGLVGMVAGLAGITRSRPSWRRLSVLSVSCGALALLLEGPSSEIIPLWSVGFGYIGIWLGGLLGLVAIGAAIGTFLLPMRNKALDMSLAVFGLLAGLPCALLALWILGLTIGPGMGG